MLEAIKYWCYNKFFRSYVNAELIAQCNISNIEKANLEAKLNDQRYSIQRYEDMLANKNFKAITAQQLYVTDHALHQYRKRIGFNGSDEELRKMIYKLTIRHLATMDKLQDGHYKINDKAAVRVKDNTVCTVVNASKRQS